MRAMPSRPRGKSTATNTSSYDWWRSKFGTKPNCRTYACRSEMRTRSAASETIAKKSNARVAPSGGGAARMLLDPRCGRAVAGGRGQTLEPVCVRQARAKNFTMRTAHGVCVRA